MLTNSPDLRFGHMEVVVWVVLRIHCQECTLFPQDPCPSFGSENVPLFDLLVTSLHSLPKRDLEPVIKSAVSAASPRAWDLQERAPRHPHAEPSSRRSSGSRRPVVCCSLLYHGLQIPSQEAALAAELTETM